jgi:hypothetical protein
MGRNSQHSQGSQPSHDTGRVADDAHGHEDAGLLQGGHASRAEEWRDPHPSGEGEPKVAWTPGTPEQPGTPSGMTNQDVEDRTDLARFLGKDVWPADRDTLVAKAEENDASDAVVSRLRRLPADRQFTNLQDVSRELGIGTEQSRETSA